MSDTIAGALRRCVVCQEELPTTEFYKHPHGLYGVQSKCKPCMRIYMRQHRLSKREYYRKYDSDRYQMGRKIVTRDEKKKRATAMVNIRVQRGTMDKPTQCSRCDSTDRIEAHHEDYDQPLVVTWLCRLCHADHHATEKLRADAHAN